MIPSPAQNRFRSQALQSQAGVELQRLPQVINIFVLNKVHKGYYLFDGSNPLFCFFR